MYVSATLRVYECSVFGTLMLGQDLCLWDKLEIVKDCPGHAFCHSSEGMLFAGKAGVVSNSFAYGISTVALTKDEVAAAGRCAAASIITSSEDETM
jgi:hypothetical protein